MMASMPPNHPDVSVGTALQQTDQRIKTLVLAGTAEARAVVAAGVVVGGAVGRGAATSHRGP